MKKKIYAQNGEISVRGPESGDKNTKVDISHEERMFISHEESDIKNAEICVHDTAM